MDSGLLASKGRPGAAGEGRLAGGDAELIWFTSRGAACGLVSSRSLRLEQVATFVFIGGDPFAFKTTGLHAWELSERDFPVSACDSIFTLLSLFV